MNAVAARRSGAPSQPVRIVSLVLAALGSGIPLLVLLLGLSVHAIRTMGAPTQLIELLPYTAPTPEPREPPPAPSVPRPRPEPARAAPEPAPLAAAPPATPVDRTPARLAPPAPATAPESAAGTSAGTGTADGTAGSGTGGNGAGGSGSGGGLLEPSWVVEAGYRELAPHNPPRARIDKVNGTVLLACRGTPARRVRDCRVLYEKPRGYGFGEAAVAASRSFQINPPMRDGRIDERAWIGIPISFNNRPGR